MEIVNYLAKKLRKAEGLSYISYFGDVKVTLLENKFSIDPSNKESSIIYTNHFLYGDSDEVWTKSQYVFNPAKIDYLRYDRDSEGQSFGTLRLFLIDKSVKVLRDSNKLGTSELIIQQVSIQFAQTNEGELKKLTEELLELKDLYKARQ